MPLAETGWSSVHSVIDEIFLGDVENLRLRRGGILVLSSHDDSVKGI